MRTIRPLLLTLIFLLGSLPGTISAAEIPYWAGHKSVMEDRYGNELRVKYSEDGKKYYVVWGYFLGDSSDKCSGDVSGEGNLETIECTPSDKSTDRDIGGSVQKIELIDYFGFGPAGPWLDIKLKKKSQEYAQKSSEEKRIRQELARKKAEEERVRQELARKNAEEERVRQELARKAGAERVRQELARKNAEEERVRQELARKAGEERVRQELTKKAEEKRLRKLEKDRRINKEIRYVKNLSEAKYFLKDFKEFVIKEPNVFDRFKIAELFGPAQEVVLKGRYSLKNKTFRKLVKYANTDSNYLAYRRNMYLKRKAEMALRRKPLVSDIKNILSFIKAKIQSDPLNPISSKLIKILKKHEKKPLKGQTFNDLVSTLTAISSEVRGFGIEPPVNSFLISNKSSRGKKDKKDKKLVSRLKTIPQLRKIKANDIVFLVSVNSSAPHAYKDLNGDIKFENETIVLCGPNRDKWNRQALQFAKKKLTELYPKHRWKDGNCKKKIESVDVIFSRGVDLAKSRKLPSEVAIVKGFRSKTLSILLTVKEKDVSDELKRRSILSRQYKNDILEKTRSGFGAISGNNSSSVSCVVVTDYRDAHQLFVDQASEAWAFRSGISIKKNVDMSLDNSFKELQKKNCGIVYGGENSLKKLLEAAKLANIKVEVLPVWTSLAKVEKHAASLLEKQNTHEKSKAERQAALRRKMVEDKKQRAARAAELANRQAQYRKTYGAKVTSLVANIDAQLKIVRSKIDKTLSEMGSVKSEVNKLSFWGELPFWYATQRQKGWEFGSTVTTPQDYGTANWKGRNIKAIVAKVRFLMKQRDLGEYSDTCWYVGYLDDSEFNMKRRSFVGSCEKINALKKWFVINRFETKWNLEVK